MPPTPKLVHKLYNLQWRLHVTENALKSLAAELDATLAEAALQGFPMPSKAPAGPCDHRYTIHHVAEGGRVECVKCWTTLKEKPQHGQH